MLAVVTCDVVVMIKSKQLLCLLSPHAKSFFRTIPHMTTSSMSCFDMSV